MAKAQLKANYLASISSIAGANDVRAPAARFICIRQSRLVKQHPHRQESEADCLLGTGRGVEW